MVARLLLLLVMRARRATLENSLMELRNTCPLEPIRSKDTCTTNQWEARLLQSQRWATGELSINRMEAIIWVNLGSVPGQWCNSVCSTQMIGRIGKLKCKGYSVNLENRLKWVYLTPPHNSPDSASGNNFKDDPIHLGQKARQQTNQIREGWADVLIHEFD